MNPLLHHKEFRHFLASRFLGLASHQMMLVALGQAVFELTHSPLHLGYIGLVLFLPKFGLSLWAGHTADRYDRRTVILVCRGVQVVLLIGLTLNLFYRPHSLGSLYTLLFLLGVAHTFDGPANQAIVTQIVPGKDFHRAVAWNSSTMQVALIAGPALGGWFYVLLHGALGVLIFVAGLRFLSLLFITRLYPRTDHIEHSDWSWTELVAGLRYVFNTRLILGAISMDLFAVLFGGAVALLPIYANDILRVGPSGLGLLRAAPSVGATLMALLLATRPLRHRVGLKMLWCVALFGLFTILFGTSHHFLFSLFCLAILGAADMVSVVTRGILVQTETPAAMRGRVSAVNLIFIGASNELGEFESGVTAAWFGVVPSVVIGGLGTLAVVSIWAWRFPELRRYWMTSSSEDPALPV